MNIGVIKDIAIKNGSRALLIAKKYSPEILMVAGTVAIVAGTVATAKATLKVDEILEENKENKEKIESVHNGEIELEEGVEYSEEDYKKDILINKINCGKKLVKEYAPGITLTVLGISCFFGAHGIMKKRNVALVAAYKLCEETFNNYRDRVRTELGEDQDRHFYYGTEFETKSEKIKTENGKTKTVKTKTEVIPGIQVSQYARFFDESNPNWSKSPEQNKFFLETAQNMLNDMLRSRGHLFLNEVYDNLGFERSAAGAVVGWIWNDGNIGEDGDGYVDFNIFQMNDVTKRDFVNGYEPSILLDFNVDGVIYDLI